MVDDLFGLSLVSLRLLVYYLRLRKDKQSSQAEEVRRIGGKLITVPTVNVLNPAFDLTPARYITAVITEKGIARPLFEESLKELKNKD